MPTDSPNGVTEGEFKRALLVVAHPGHELRVHGWLELTKPEVWVLTDGSGRTAQSRVRSTDRVLAATGAVAGPVYGQMTDADIYKAILDFDHARFKALVDQLATALIDKQIDCIAGDAEEGYNPAHDTCRLVVNAAVELAMRNTSKQIANYDFALVGPPNRCPDELRARSLWINLDDASFARKISAAQGYPELASEIEAAFQGTLHESRRDYAELFHRSRSRFGTSDVNNFRVECLRPVNDGGNATTFNDSPPYYEEYGERQVSVGHYTHVLRYNEHMVPLAAAIDSHVKRNC